MTPALDALERLREGNHRFVSDEVSEEALASREHRAGAAAPQNPFAIILACSYSSVPTELILYQGIGDIFVIRGAGKIVAPSQIGSIEYAAKQFGTPLVVVLGHSNCGAIIATLQELALNESHRSPNLRAIVDRIRPAVEPVIGDQLNVDDEATITRCVRANVRASVEQLQHGSLIVEQLIDANELRIVGAEYSIETGRIEFFEED
jgi:carbonic anhydrase